jgi:hypothetical protein
MLNRQIIMANQATKATNVATLVIGTSYVISVTGFTYIKDFALIKGKVSETGDSVGVIIGDKMSFGMRDMFELKNSNGIVAKYSKDKLVNGVTYKQFSLEEILF